VKKNIKTIGPEIKEAAEDSGSGKVCI